jgi:hypothetical protein
MTDRPEEKPKIENLELNRETLQDLTKEQSEQAHGGALAAAGPARELTDYGTCGCPTTPFDTCPFTGKLDRTCQC